jgi:hypothetical protein
VYPQKGGLKYSLNTLALNTGEQSSVHMARNECTEPIRLKDLCALKQLCSSALKHRDCVYVYVFLNSRVCYITHVIFFDLIILIIFSENYKLCISSLCSFLLSPFTSSFFGPDVLLCIVYSRTLQILSLVWETRLYTYIKQCTKW